MTLLDVVCKGKVRKNKNKYEIPPVIDYANSHNLNQISWDHVKAEKCFQREYDLGVVASFGDFIPGPLVSTLKCGAINFHPSLLPRWRGAAPVIHTVLNGDLITGVSVIEVSKKKFDAGKILYQTQCTIPPECTGDNLLADLSLKSGELVPFVLRHLDALRKTSYSQNEELTTHAPKVDVSWRNINFQNHTASYVRRLQRALPSSMGIWASWDGARVKLGPILDLQETVGDSELPIGGCWYEKRTRLLWIQLREGCIAVKSLRFECKRDMTAKHFHSSMMKGSCPSVIFKTISPTGENQCNTM